MRCCAILDPEGRHPRSLLPCQQTVGPCKQTLPTASTPPPHDSEQPKTIRLRSPRPNTIAQRPNMSYNGRMSMARTTQHNQRAPPANEHDAFMTLVCAQPPSDFAHH